MYITMFKASWCQPCKAMEPTFDEMERKHPKHVFNKIQIDEGDNVKYARSQAVMSVPTIVVYDNNSQEVDRKNGLMMPEAMEEWINGI